MTTFRKLQSTFVKYVDRRDCSATTTTSSFQAPTATKSTSRFAASGRCTASAVSAFAPAFPAASRAAATAASASSSPLWNARAACLSFRNAGSPSAARVAAVMGALPRVSRRGVPGGTAIAAAAALSSLLFRASRSAPPSPPASLLPLPVSRSRGARSASAARSRRNASIRLDTSPEPITSSSFASVSPRDPAAFAAPFRPSPKGET